MTDSFHQSMKATISEMKSIIESVISRMPTKFKLLSMQQFVDLIGGDLENAIANNDKLARLRATAVKAQQISLRHPDDQTVPPSSRKNVEALELAFNTKQTEAK